MKEQHISSCHCKQSHRSEGMISFSVTLARPFRAIRCERSEQRMCTFHKQQKALVSCPLCKGNQCFSILIVDEYTTHLTACQVVKFKPVRRDQNGTHGSSIAGERC